jgi:tetratricopeptide (TPR) repeat protein
MRAAERDKLAAEVRAAEQAKRRRAVQRDAGIVAAVLLLGIAGTTAGLLSANVARRDAETAQQAAVEKEAEANAALTFLENKVFAAGRPKGTEGGLGSDVTLLEALVASLPALGTEFGGQPLVEARLRLTLGRTFWHAGQASEAVMQLEQARAIYAARLGPAHPDTLTSMHNLALSYDELGRHANALELGEQVLTARRRVLGPDHPDTLWSMNNLAIDYVRAGRPGDASRLHRQVLDARRRVLGRQHRHTLSSLANLAGCYAAQGRHADALELYEEALCDRRRVLTADHPETVQSLWDVAACLVNLNRVAEAVPLMDEYVSRAAGRVYPQIVQAVVDLRLRHFQRHCDPAGCRATAEMWEKLNRPDHVSLYNAACLRAVAASVYAKANQPAEATADADRAMGWLTKAVAAGFTDRIHMGWDKDLDVLRPCPDFQKLLAPSRRTARPPRGRGPCGRMTTPLQEVPT